jgi:ankyrin repeat protein
MAIEKGKEEMAPFLLAKRANIDVAKDSTFRPLHCTVQRGLLRVVEELLARGADINERGHDWDTPLIVAAIKKAAKRRRPPR